MAKPGKVPTYAKNTTDLGAYLAPPRDRKIIQRAMKVEGNPGRTKDGRYHIQEWQGFINANFASLSDPTVVGSADKRNLEMEKLRLQNSKLEFELSIRKREYSANADVETWVGDMILKAKTILRGMENKLPPLLEGRSAVDIQRLLRDEIHSCLLQLSLKPLGK